MGQNERKELFKQVALVQLSARMGGVLKGSVEGTVVCPSFLQDVALISEAILKSSEEFSNNVVSQKFKQRVEEVITQHRELISKLYDKKEEPVPNG